MKPLPRGCCISLLALTVVACGSVPTLNTQLRRFDRGTETYVARAGDSLDTIAYRYRLSTTELAALNPDLSHQIAAGTPVFIRRSSQQSASHTTNVAQRTNSQHSATTQPVHSLKAIGSYEVESLVSAEGYAPAVSAVVSDMALVIPSSRKQDKIRRNGVVESSAYSKNEFIEEVYVHPPSVQKSFGGWIWPTHGPIARGYAPSTEGRHGVDIAGLPGQPVVAVMDGTVDYSGKNPAGAGNLIIVRHPNNLLTAYSFTQDLYVARHDTVTAGDPIASLGANAQHESVLRFEVVQDGNLLNPMDFLPSR